MKHAASHALMRCLVREARLADCAVTIARSDITVELVRSQVRLVAKLATPGTWPAFQFAGPVMRETTDSQTPLSALELAEVIATELSASTGQHNAEFLAQVSESVQASAAIAANRALSTEPADPYVASEQALVVGHPCHPAPKARQDTTGQWRRYAPETHSRFRVQQLAIATEVLAGDEIDAAGKTFEALGPAAPAGFLPLPAHPWQLALLANDGELRRLRDSGALIEVGTGVECSPTSSVRTCYFKENDAFIKFSLNVRITNCVRKNSWYELANSTVLSRIISELNPLLRAEYRASVLLEPAYRSAATAGGRAHEGLAVILREGVRSHLPEDGKLVLAGAIAAGHWLPDSTSALDWWQRYLARVIPPVIELYLEHGIVLEPHVQNVLIGLDSENMPTSAIFRDLEGTKILPDYHRRWLPELDPIAAKNLQYSARDGWNRLTYCLFVNHLAELAAAIAARHPGIAAKLWPSVDAQLSALQERWGHRSELCSVRTAPYWPAKANLWVRWQRSADRAATYVPVRNPLLSR